MIEKTRGIVLHTLKYGDSSLISHVYTDNFGRQSFLIKGARNKKSGTSFALFLPLNILEIEFYHKTTSSLNKTKEISISKTYLNLNSDPHKTPITLFISELLYKILKEENSNTSLFEFFCHSFDFFDRIRTNYIDFLIIFLIRLAEYEGFAPTDNFSEKNNCFNISKGIFEHIEIEDNLLKTEVEKIILPSDAYHFFNYLRSDYDKIDDFSIDNQMKLNILNKLIEYFKIHIHGLGQLKSTSLITDQFFL